VIRLFVNRFLRYPPVTDAERLEMELPVRDTTPTPRPEPPTRPEFYLRGHDTRLVDVHFKDQGSESKARPEGYDGAVVYWSVGDACPKAGGFWAWSLLRKLHTINSWSFAKQNSELSGAAG
jgi:hypothetical protein